MLPPTLPDRAASDLQVWFAGRGRFNHRGRPLHWCLQGVCLVNGSHLLPLKSRSSRSQAIAVFSASWVEVAGLCHARPLVLHGWSFSRFNGEVEAFWRNGCSAGPTVGCWLAVATVTVPVTAFIPCLVVLCPFPVLTKVSALPRADDCGSLTRNAATYHLAPRDAGSSIRISSGCEPARRNR